MSFGRRIPVPVSVLLVALATRLAGIAVTTLTDLNTYARADADRFAALAADYAATLSAGHVPSVVLGPNTIAEMWGLALSPFWLVPGPSRVYARAGSAVLGVFAVYALYRLGAAIHSRRAGAIAALPMAVYPSYVFVHSAVLRESFVLAGLLWATALLAGASRTGRSTVTRCALAAALVAAVSLVRWENLPLYALTVGTGLAVAYRRSIPHPRAVISLAAGGSLVAAWIARPALEWAVAFLATKRRKRAEGRTVYFPEFVPDTLPKLVAFAPVGAVYFLFAPFPWMVGTVADAVVLVEALGNLVAAGLAVAALPVLWRRRPAVTAALSVGFLAAALLYGVANANVGTAVRQRQMFLWVVFLFAGVAVAERLNDRWWPRWLR